MQNQNRFYTFWINVEKFSNFLKVWKIMKTTNEIQLRSTKKNTNETKRFQLRPQYKTDQNRNWKLFKRKWNHLCLTRINSKNNWNLGTLFLHMSVNFWFEITTQKFRSNAVIGEQEIPTSNKKKHYSKKRKSLKTILRVSLCMTALEDSSSEVPHREYGMLFACQCVEINKQVCV